MSFIKKITPARRCCDRRPKKKRAPQAAKISEEERTSLLFFLAVIGPPSLTLFESFRALEISEVIRL